MQRNIVVLIGGGHAAGKSTTAEYIRKEVENLPFYSTSSLHIEIIDMTNYDSVGRLRNGPVSTEEKAATQKLKPTRFNFVALERDLQSKLICEEGDTQKLIIVHGLYALYDKNICKLSQMKVYMDSDADTRLIRWIRKDVLFEQSGKLEDVIGLYLNGAKQEMTDYIFHTKERADVIMPRGAETNGVSLIVDGLLPHIGFAKFLERNLSSNLRPYKNERFDTQKGNYYELN